MKYTIVWLSLALMLISSMEYPQQSNPARFADYDFSQYITSSGYAPENIINLDNNSELVLSCVLGKTKDQLKASGISFTESQLVLLKTWKVLEEKGDTFRTAFPIINLEEMLRLRNYSKTAAAKLCGDIKSEITQLANELTSIGRTSNTYTILFSYILDNFVWNIFERNKILDQRQITAENPFWTGEIWASYPKRDFFCGTNSISDKGVSMKVNWNEQAIPQMLPFVSDWKNFGKMFDDYVEKGKIENEEAKKVFAPFTLFDAAGVFTVPIIDENNSSGIYQISQIISQKVADRVPVILNIDQLTQEFKFRDNKQALVIVYHELMWDLLDELENSGIIKKPLAFANPNKAEPKDIADLVFMVREKK